MIWPRPIKATSWKSVNLAHELLRTRTQEFDDLCGGRSSTAAQSTEPAVRFPAAEEDLPVALDAKAAPEAGTAFDGQSQLAAQGVGDLLGRLLESAGAAIVNHDERVQITRLLAGGQLSVVGGPLYK